jgi:hypothetical protein
VTGSARHCCPRSWRSPSSPAFNGFPALGSILAQDRYLPRQLHTRGDRLAFGNGIVLLAGFASLLVVAFQAEVTRPIQLCNIGVFVSFTCSQPGMVRHWRRLLHTERDPSPRDVVTVFVPEYVVGHWWEALLHNQSAFRIKTRLRFLPGVMVTSVPYQLRSSDRPGAQRETAAPGQPRRLARAGVVNAPIAPEAAAADGVRPGAPGG